MLENVVINVGERKILRTVVSEFFFVKDTGLAFVCYVCYEYAKDVDAFCF